MATRHVVFALAAGTILSGAVTGLMAFTNPYAAFPRLSARHPLAAYAALGGAPTGSWLVTLAVSAPIYAACLLAAGLLARRGRGPQMPPPDPDYQPAGGEPPWSS